MRFFSNTTLENQVCRPKSGINLYPFGQTMPGRNWMSTVGGYRYANQGKEKDDEIFSGAQDFEARELDNRIGRFWSLDPHQNRYPSSSPYSVTYNSPNLFVDKDGRDNIIYIVDFSSNNPALNLPNAAAQSQQSGCSSPTYRAAWVCLRQKCAAHLTAERARTRSLRDTD